MRPRKPFPADSVTILQALLGKAERTEDARRIQAVLIRAVDDIPSERIAVMVGLSVATVRSLHSQFLRNGAACLMDRPGRGGNRRRNLDDETEKRILAGFIERSKVGCILNVGEIRVAIEAAIGRPVATSTIYRLMIRHGWRKVAPTSASPQSRSCRHRAVQKKLADITANEKAALKAGQSLRLLFQDEARFGRISELYRCWAPGQIRPSCPQQLVREAVYLFGAVSPHDGRLVTSIEQKANTESMARFLTKTVDQFPHDRLLMVLDGAGWHKAKALQVPERMRLITLPPYCPDLNPAEHLWEAIRMRYFANRLFATLGAVEAQLITGAEELAANPAGLTSLTYFPWIRLCVL
jgi:transposase